jgi:hypothetical protein
MQLYDGLPILTNKMPVEEREGVPHHLLGCVKLDEEPWTVDVYTWRALQVVRTSLPACLLASAFLTPTKSYLPRRQALLPLRCGAL